jgi:hypothetical protein
MVFASELAKCRTFKRISNILLTIAVLAFLWMIITTPTNIKTDKDYVYEYATKRLNYSYITVDMAFNNDLQYKFPNYEVFIKDELEFIKDHGVINYFYISSVQDFGNGSFSVSGKEIQLWCDRNTGKCDIKELGDKTYKIKKIKGKFQLIEDNTQTTQ